MRDRRIVEWNFDVPVNYYSIDPNPELSDAAWVDGVLDEVRTLPGVGDLGPVRDQLAEERSRFVAQKDPGLGAWVSVRPEVVASVGVLVTAKFFSLGEGDGPEGLEAMFRAGAEAPTRGRRTRSVETWRDTIAVGDLVGMFQVLEVRSLLRRPEIHHRTMFGVFPTDCTKGILFDFNVIDLATFVDMRRDTQVIVGTTTVRTEPVS